MKRNEYRVLETGEGFYPQTRGTGRLFSEDWKTIAEVLVRGEVSYLLYEDIDNVRPQESLAKATDTVRKYKNLSPPTYKIHNL